MFSQQKTAAKPASSTTTVKDKQPAAAAAPAAKATVPAQAAQPAAPETQAFPDPRSAATSSRSRSVQLPYDVEDKYMGRKGEFLNDITLPDLPADFPVYDKEWSLKEYNQVVDAYFLNHKDIVKAGVREKLEIMQH